MGYQKRGGYFTTPKSGYTYTKRDFPNQRSD